MRTLNINLRFATALLLLINAFSSTSAQEVMEPSNHPKTIHGKVLDAQTKEPLIGTTISAISQKAHTVADEYGHYMITLQDSADRLVFNFIGYSPDTLDVAAIGELVYLSPQSAEKGNTLETVQVTSRKKTTEIGLLGAMKVEKIGAGELMKAACCNLSESFETTPSVDVGFTDAVSGYKQIQMLGLAGSYTMFTRENIPDIRGLASITGLTFTPGYFVESMQLSKGTGSVVNGFEGTAGQINVEWHKPFESKTPRWMFNLYQSAQGRTEGNVLFNHNFNNRLSTSLLLHGRSDWMEVDQNKDGFLDAPKGENFVGSNRWFYFSPKGWEIQGGLKYVNVSTLGGQKGFTRSTKQEIGQPWGYTNSVRRTELWGKIGKVYPEKPYRSMGLQLAGALHGQDSRFGKNAYLGFQQSFYANYIYQSIISNTNHIIKMGTSLAYDNYSEEFNTADLKRTETVPGAFVEYAYSHLTKFNLVAGLRADYHNLFGAFLTPRLHLRYAPWERTAIRASIGRAQRTANVLTENLGMMASSRSFLINGQPFAGFDQQSYPFKPEVAWNMGLNFTQKFMLNYRDGALSFDYYFTDFKNQVVVDIEQFDKVNFYNLAGRSSSHSFQAQLDYEPLRNFDVRLAYRFYDVRTQYQNGLLQKPLTAAHRAFVNLGYETKSDWKFDYTVQWIGEKRLPQHFSDHQQHLHPSSYSKPFWLMNGQISKSFMDKRFDLYAGVENVTGEMQHPLIMDAQNPFGNNFDASLVWGSAMGRNIYVGFRYNIPQKQNGVAMEP